LINNKKMVHLPSFCFFLYLFIQELPADNTTPWVLAKSLRRRLGLSTTRSLRRRLGLSTTRSLRRRLGLSTTRSLLLRKGLFEPIRRGSSSLREA